jgi:replicative DNA helicase
VPDTDGKVSVVGARRARDKAVDDIRVPPHNVEAEQAVLGGLMLDNKTWDAIADRIVASDFYRRDHQLIFEAIAERSGRGEPADAVTLSEWLERKGLAEETGGLVYLASLVRDTPSAANIRAYADAVRERSTLRKLISVGGEIASSAYNPEGREASELVDAAERRVFEIAESGNRAGSGFIPLKEELGKVIDRLDMLHQNSGSLTGVSTGFGKLDEMTAGLQKGDLIVIAGRPSMGKTTFALNIAENAAFGPSRFKVGVFSMEMSREQLAFRMISSLGRVDQSHLRTGMFGDEEWSRINTAINMMKTASIFIDDTGALTPTEVRARARRLKREHGLDLVVLDYLQLMQVAGTKENRATEISEISRSLKALAKELAVPVIALSQLNRSVEQRTDKKPVMSDLRECVTGDTLVCLTDGRRVPIRELVGATPGVWAVDEYQSVISAQSDKVWNVGHRQVFRVQLASGRSIRATAEHRLMAGQGWRTVAELTLFDQLAVVRPALPSQRTGRSYTATSRWASSSCSAVLQTPNLAVWAEADLFWDRVTAIVPEGEEEVFDLTVPGPANWLADGIVTHNSGAIEQDADLIMMIYRDEVYDPNTTRKGIADIIIAKQRNGPIGDIQLTFLGKYTKFENFTPESSYGDGPFR